MHNWKHLQARLPLEIQDILSELLYQFAENNKIPNWKILEQNQATIPALIKTLLLANNKALLNELIAFKSDYDPALNGFLSTSVLAAVDTLINSIPNILPGSINATPISNAFAALLLLALNEAQNEEFPKDLAVIQGQIESEETNLTVTLEEWALTGASVIRTVRVPDSNQYHILIYDAYYAQKIYKVKVLDSSDTLISASDSFMVNALITQLDLNFSIENLKTDYEKMYLAIEKLIDPTALKLFNLEQAIVLASALSLDIAAVMRMVNGAYIADILNNADYAKLIFAYSTFGSVDSITELSQIDRLEFSNAIEKALDLKVVSFGPTVDVPALIDALFTDVQQFIFDGDNDQLHPDIGTIMSVLDFAEEQQKLFLETLSQQPFSTTEFIEYLRSEELFDPIIIDKVEVLHLALAVTYNDVQLIVKLNTNDELARKEILIAKTYDEWKALLTEIYTDLDDDTISNTAGEIMRNIEAREGTAFFFLHLVVESTDPLAKVKELWEAYSYDLGVNDLAKSLFEINPDDVVLQANRALIERVNRLYKIVDDVRNDLQIPALLAQGISTAFDVVDLGYLETEKLYKTIEADAWDAEKSARKVLDQAKNIVDAQVINGLQDTDAQALAAALTNDPIPDTNVSEPPVEGGDGGEGGEGGTGEEEPAMMAIPTDSTRPSAGGDLAITQSSDYCACDACSSTYSPSAYLVDLLKYLEDAPSSKKIIPDTTDLMGLFDDRRPDIRLLKLNCENSQTPLPYIDLVNEKLENIVINDGISKQTTWTAAELRVQPEYENIPALKILAGEQDTPIGMGYTSAPFVPIGLPFNYWNFSANNFLNNWDLSLSDLNKIGPSAPTAAEILQLDTVDVSLLQLSKDNYYRLFRSGAADAMGDLIYVKNIMADLNLSLEQFESLIALNYVNPTGAKIVFGEGSCDLATATFLSGTDYTDTQRKYSWSWMHKLLRLANRNNWTPLQADQLSHMARVNASPSANSWYTANQLTALSLFSSFASQHKIDSSDLWIYGYAYNASLPYMDTYKTNWMAISTKAKIVFNGEYPFENYIAAAFDGNLTNTGVLAKLPLNDAAVVSFLSVLSGLDQEIVLAAVERFNTNGVYTKAEITPLLQAYGDLLLWKNKKPESKAVLQFARLLNANIISYPSYGSNADTIANGISDLADLALQFSNLDGAQLQTFEDVIYGIPASEKTNSDSPYHESKLLPFMERLAEGSVGLYYVENAQIADLNNYTSDYIIFREGETLDSYNKKFIAQQAEVLGLSGSNAANITDALIAARDFIGTNVPSGISYYDYYQQSILGLRNNFLNVFTYSGTSTWFDGVFINPGTNTGFTLSTAQKNSIQDVIAGLCSDMGTELAAARVQQRKDMIAAVVADYFGITETLANTITETVLYYNSNSINAFLINYNLYPEDVSLADNKLLDFYRDMTQFVGVVKANAMEGNAYYLLRKINSNQHFFPFRSTTFSDEMTPAIATLNWLSYKDIAALFGAPYVPQQKKNQIASFFGSLESQEQIATNLSALFAINLSEAQLLVSQQGTLPSEMQTLAVYLEAVIAKINILKKTTLDVLALEALTHDGIEALDREKLLKQHAFKIFASSGKQETLMDAMREAKRSALVQFIAHYDPNNSLESPEAIFHKILMDVEMEACMMTSRMVEATLAIQQFCTRIQFGMELVGETTLRFDKSFETDWLTLGNYRVWEANRKVLTYPENYLEPELRDNKTHLYQSMTDAIAEANFDNDAIQTSYLKYLYEVEDMSHLEVAHVYNEYRDKEAQQDIIHLIARTREEPKKYFYRSFKDGAWDQFIKIDVPIENDYSFPVFYGGRLFLFWLNIEENMQPLTQKEMEDSNNQNRDQTKLVKYKIWISWSSYNSNERKWENVHRSKDYIESFESEKSGILQNQFFVTTQVSIYDVLTFRVFEQVENKRANGPATFIYALKSWFVMDHPRANIVKNDPGLTRIQSLEQDQGTVQVANANGVYNPPINYVVAHEMMYSRENFKGSSQAPDLGNNKYHFKPGALALNYSGMYEDYEDRPQDFVEHPDYTEYEDNQANSRKTLFYKSHGLPFSLTLISNTAYKSYGRDRVNKFLDHFFYENVKHIFFANYLHTCEEKLSLTYSTQHTVVRESQVNCSARIDKTDSVVYSPAPPTKAEQQISPGSQSFATNARPVFATTGRKDISSERYSCRTYETTYETQHKWNYGIERTRQYQVHPFYHPYLSLLIKEVSKYGYEGVLKPLNVGADSELYRQSKAKDYFVDQYYQENNDNLIVSPYPADDFNFDFSSGYGLYNWELFFFTPLFIANELNKSGNYEQADKWFRYIFDPSNNAENKPKDYWNFKPFHEIYGSNGLANGGIKKLIDGLVLGRGDAYTQFFAWKNNPFNPHAIARLRQGAYLKMFVRKYLENLLDWGDAHFTTFSQESINEALLIYKLVKSFLGNKPVQTHGGEGTARNYDEHKAHVASYTASSEGWENENGISPCVTTTESGEGVSANYVSLLGFCQLPNTDLFDLWDRVDDRLYKIHNCLNIDGIKVDLPLFAPVIDPAALVAAVAGGLSLSSALNALNASLPLYRFQWLHQKAVQYANEAKALGNALQTALEKKDAEALAQLQQKQGINVNKSILKIREKSIEEANLSLEAHLQLIENATFREKHYENLLKEGQLGGEKTQLTLMSVAATQHIVNTVFAAIGGAVNAIPDVQTGYASLGGFLTAGFGGTKAGKIIDKSGDAVDALISNFNEMASIAGLASSWSRRKQDWQFQKDVATRDIVQLEKQKKLNELRIQMAEQELENQEQQLANSEQTLDFYQSKFSNKDLYHYLSGELRKLHTKSVKQAHQLANMAQTTLKFELPKTTETFIDPAYLKGGNSNLMAADNLLNDLREMELAHIGGNKREMEITKHFSLALFNPNALMDLKENGFCAFETPEWAYDMDYPGMYMRRIKAVRLSIPCVTGPNIQVNAKLTLTGNKMRVKTAHSDYMSDDNFVFNRTGVQTIAAAEAQQDDGLFQFDFNDVRYLPFEGAGAHASWSLELPDGLRQFDYSSISDVILHIDYMALQAGGLLAEAAKTNVNDMFETHGYVMFSVRNLYGDAFEALTSALQEITVDSRVLPPMLQGKNVTFENTAKSIATVIDGQIADYPAASFNGTNVSLPKWTAGSLPDDVLIVLDIKSL